MEVLTFWSLEPTAPARKLRYHLGQVAMIRLMNDLAQKGCKVRALICDSEARSIVGEHGARISRDVEVSKRFIETLTDSAVQTRRMSEFVNDGYNPSTADLANKVVNGALRFRNSIQHHRPPKAVLDGLPRFRAWSAFSRLDEPTETYLSKLQSEFPDVSKAELLAALFASVRRPKWFDAFWVGELAAWVAMRAKESKTVILEANRSAYSWLTHRCFMAIGAAHEEPGSEPYWPAMCFVAPVLSLAGDQPMQLSAPEQAIFLHHSRKGLEDRLQRTSPSSLQSYRKWLLPDLVETATESDIRRALLERVEERKGRFDQDFLRPKLSAPARVPSLPGDWRIALCLSGGGFRATFFHLGVVKLLRDAGLMKHIMAIYSVSGGSILAANLALHWQEYAERQDDHSFLKASLPLRKLASADIRSRICRRWLISPWRWLGGWNTYGLAGYYETLGGFGKKELKDLPRSPTFSFLATSMKTGKVVSFTREGFDDGTGAIVQYPDLQIAQAVAASSAFPPLFPAIHLSNFLKAEDRGRRGTEPVTDGGVYDNLGLRRLLTDAAEKSDERWCTVALVSDASAPFTLSTPDKFQTLANRAIRTTDILMKRVGELEADAHAAAVNADDGSAQPYIVHARIDTLVATDAPMPGAPNSYKRQEQRIQSLTSEIRTDLDKFSTAEIAALVRHGYEVALDSTTRAGMVPRDFQPRDPCVTNSTQDEKLREQLENSGKRRLGLFSFSDWLCWLVLGILLVISILLWRRHTPL